MRHFPLSRLCAVALLSTAILFCGPNWTRSGVEITRVSAQEDGSFASLIGKDAPDFTLEDLHGKKVTLSSYRGKAVLVNFWATWCAPCKFETPWLVELREQYSAKGFEMLAVNNDELSSDATKRETQMKRINKAAQDLKISYPVLVGGANLAKPYDALDSLPASLFIDRNGKVVAVQSGITSKSEIEEKILKSLQ